MKHFTKTKASSILNVLGMTIAFTAFYVIMSQVMYDVTYNKCIKDANNKYMICTSHGEDHWSTLIPVQMSQRVADGIPGASIGFLHLPEYADKVYADKGNDEKCYHFGVHFFTKGGADNLGVQFIAGMYPQKDEDVAVSEKVAETMSIAPGDYISIYDPMQKKKVPAAVTGIYKSFAANSDFADCDILWNKESTIMSDPDGNLNFNAVVSFSEQSDIEKFIQLFRKYDNEYAKTIVEAAGIGADQQDEIIKKIATSIKLVPISEIHFSDVNDYANDRTSYTSVYTLVGIALLIIIIAFINFINFFIALVPEKMKSANIRKVFGASRSSLVGEFIKESLGYVGAAILLSLVSILAVSKSPISEFTDGGISLGGNLLAFGILIGISLIFATLSALFPAMYVTNTNAALGVKSGFSRSRTGRFLRKGLITMQLSIAASMMVVSVVFFLQYRHMTNMQLGFDKEHLYGAAIPYYKSDVKSRLESIAGIKAVSASSNPITGNSGMQMMIRDPQTSNELILKVRRVLPNYFEVTGLPLISGEGFTENNVGTMVLSASSLDRFTDNDLKRLLNHEPCSLVGYCAETNTKPATDMTADVIEAYQNEGYNCEDLCYLVFRAESGADPKHVITQVKETLKSEYDLDEDPNVLSVDDELAERYAKFKTQSIIIGLFSIIAIIIALMGVFGIVLFETEHRRHETAVRKVLGAEGTDIVSLFCKQYAWTVAAACFIATPVAIMVTRRWLQQFTTQVHVSPLIYMVAFAIVAVLTLGIIAVRTAVASKENPVNNLKSE